MTTPALSAWRTPRTWLVAPSGALAAACVLYVATENNRREVRSVAHSEGALSASADARSIASPRNDLRQRAGAALDRYYRLHAEEIFQQYQQRISSKGDRLSVPQSSQKLPPEEFFRTLTPENIRDSDGLCVKYVIVGAGTAAWSAVQAIATREPSAQVLVIGDEEYMPYNRTPLSKEQWDSDDGELSYTNSRGRKVRLEYSYTAPSSRTSILRSTHVESLDTAKKHVALRAGQTIGYDKLLLATGGRPGLAELVSPDLLVPSVADRVLTFRTIDDFRELDRITRDASMKEITVIGGGFLGVELSCTLSKLQKQRGFSTTLLFPEPGVLYKVLPRYLSEYLAHRLRAGGVDVQPSTIVTGVTRQGEGAEVPALRLDTLSFEPSSKQTDRVVVAVGVLPRSELAQNAGLALDAINGGIVVDEHLQAAADVFAAGDVASFLDPMLGRRRVEHWDHALISGRVAGENMAGGSSKYDLQSMFWCDLGAIDVSIEAVGLVDSKLDSAGVWNLKDAPSFALFPGSFSRHSYEAGVVWYLRHGVVVGALLWNLDHAALNVAREVIENKTEVVDDTQLSQLVELPPSSHRIIIGVNDSR